MGPQTVFRSESRSVSSYWGCEAGGRAVAGAGRGKAGDGSSWEAGHCIDTDCGLYYSCSAGPGIHHLTRGQSILLLFICLFTKWVQFVWLRKTFSFFTWFGSSSIDLIWSLHSFPSVCLNTSLIKPMKGRMSSKFSAAGCSCWQNLTQFAADGSETWIGAFTILLECNVTLTHFQQCFPWIY